jgi:glycosyltransferase involved in cell wall biosynthesis
VTEPSRRAGNDPLQLFYAGHLAQRKGIAYLIEALHRLDVPWRLTLAGSAPERMPDPLRTFLTDPRCRWLGQLPQPALLKEMTQAHVFVFPSIVEGFGMVLFEAMAAGLPVITTPNTAAPDIMTDGREGYIVPIRDPDAIAARLAGMYADEAARQGMAEAALTRAAASSWRLYEDGISDVLDEVVS